MIGIRSGRVGRRFRHAGGAAAFLLLHLFAAGAVEARQRPSDDVYTRSIALNLSQARSARSDAARERLYRLALEAAREGMEKSPGNPRVWFLAGQAHVAVAATASPEEAAELYATAAEAFTRAVTMYPGYEAEVAEERANAWVQAYNAGVTAQNRGELDLARLHFERADRIYDGRPEARFYLAQLYHVAGDLDRSAAAYRGAIEILDAIIAAPRGRRVGAGGGMSPAEAAEMRRAAVFNLAQVLATAGRYEEAAGVYAEVLASDPDDYLARLNLATISSRLGRHDEAAGHFEALLARNDLYATDLFSIGVGLFQAGRTEAALRAFREAREVNPHYRDALYHELSVGYQHATDLLTAWASAEAGEREERRVALEAFLGELLETAERFVALDPRNTTARSIQQRVYLALADMTADAGAADSLRAAAVALQEEVDAWDYHVTGLRTVNEGLSIRVEGQVENAREAEGGSAALRFTFYGVGGLELGTRDVTVVLPPAPGAADFGLEFTSSIEITGFAYAPIE